MGKLFGTDGVRGIVNKDLTKELAYKIGASVARVLKKELNKDKLTFLIGSDTRESKDMLSSAVKEGVASEGCEIVDVGVLPTPGISFLTEDKNFDGSFIVSASHNPSEYNGIKVLDNKGCKLSEMLEEACEEIILNDFRPSDNHIRGEIKADSSMEEDYVKHLASTIDTDISGIRILVDTANGAAYDTANKLFTMLGANFDIINNTPDGININRNAGSTHIEGLKNKVVEGKYDIGIAYDGDADRCILVDELGNEIDGDYIIAITGNDLKKEGKLTNNTLVGTIMSNLGFIIFCRENDINFIPTKVGDKYVLDEMMKHNYIIGGEQSGHIIFKELANTGDGELTSLQILSIMAKNNKKLSELASIMKKYPQVLVNVNTTKEGKELYEKCEDIQEKKKYYEEELGSNGRIVLRPSGTENLIRVMLEGDDMEQITRICNELADYISKRINGTGNQNVNTLKKTIE